MSRESLLKDLSQRRFDLRCSIHLHRRRIAALDKRLVATDLLSLCVPILFFSGRYFPQSSLKNAVQCAADVSGVLLLAWGVASLVLEWRNKLKNHQALHTENYVQGDRIDSVLRAPSPSDESISRVLDETTRLASQDSALMPSLSRGEKQRAYVDALKQEGVDAACPVCGQSPWSPVGFRTWFRAKCEACGRVPKQLSGPTSP